MPAAGSDLRRLNLFAGLSNAACRRFRPLAADGRRRSVFVAPAALAGDALLRFSFGVAPRALIPGAEVA
jgi:hypothetical protein